MKLNQDFEQRVVIRPEDASWVPSPMAGVNRKMLERLGDEVARATSIVRYAPNSSFASHAHDGGEEIFVLDGVFSDEHGDYSAGTYLRNPAGSAHQPSSESGCTLFVKLHQFDRYDQRRVLINTTQTSWRPGMIAGLSVMPLHEFAGEHVALVRWAPNTYFNRHQHWGGEEIFVLEGVFEDEHGSYPKGTWIRSPHRSQHTPYSVTGCVIYVKTGHLPGPEPSNWTRANAE